VLPGLFAEAGIAEEVLFRGDDLARKKAWEHRSGAPTPHQQLTNS
jgi:hypothetical protein